MGSPASENDIQDEKQVSVKLTTGFWLGKYEVTQREWTQGMASEPWKGKDQTKEGDDFPATYLSWEDATTFADKLTREERAAGRLSDEWKYTLPTEAQWEYACRARSRTTTRFSFGDDESQLSEYGWWGGLVGGGNAKNEQHAHRVGQKKPNAWGLCDMHGNVLEWCRDGYTKNLPGGTDPEDTSKDSFRLLRGGSWAGNASDCRSARRASTLPRNSASVVGFRLALSSVR